MLAYLTSLVSIQNQPFRNISYIFHLQLLCVNNLYMRMYHLLTCISSFILVGFKYDSISITAILTVRDLNNPLRIPLPSRVPS